MKIIKFTPEKQPKGKVATKYLFMQIIIVSLFLLVAFWSLWENFVK